MFLKKGEGAKKSSSPILRGSCRHVSQKMGNEQKKVITYFDLRGSCRHVPQKWAMSKKTNIPLLLSFAFTTG